VGQMIPRVFHSEMDPSNHTKITNSETWSLSLLTRMACRRNKTATHRLVQQFFNEGHYGASLFER
ncbi:hypothetical protein, partial [Sutterella wadsworthensis]|uniref:hypothetical protein n=1 Tax=Sutterella wadsworthensis TaxID=40545 RepID=UPI0039678FB1